MLKDLKVLNGHLDLPFNEYIYEYTVTVNKDITYLDLEYDTLENVFVEVNKNDLNTSNEVEIVVYNDTDIVTYKLYVYKELEQEVNGLLEYKNSLEVIDKSIELYKIQILSISLFLILIIIFSFIFRKKHKNN